MAGSRASDIICAAGAIIRPVIRDSVYRGRVRCGIETAEPTASGASLRPRRCRRAGCGALFFVCCRCDRGQCYCCQPCRAEARRQQRRAASRRYQRTEPGKRAHCHRQRAYRRRHCHPRVTDQGSRPITEPGVVSAHDSPRCSICGCHSHWIDPFSRFRPRRRHRSATRPPAAVQKTTFLHDR